MVIVILSGLEDVCASSHTSLEEDWNLPSQSLSNLQYDQASGLVTLHFISFVEQEMADSPLSEQKLMQESNQAADLHDLRLHFRPP